MMNTYGGQVKSEKLDAYEENMEAQVRYIGYYITIIDL